MEHRMVLPNEGHRDAWFAALKAFEDAGEDVYPYGLHGSGPRDDFEGYLAEAKALQEGLHINGLSPADTYYLMNHAGEILGAVNLRYELTEYLAKYGGHIGYGVIPGERGKGYATYMLKYALEIYREKGFARVLVMCNEHNHASAKVIERCGGVLSDKITEENGNVLRHYWVQL